MKIKRAKITSVEYSVSMNTDAVIEAIKDKFERMLTLEAGIPSGDIDREDFVVSVSVGSKDDVIVDISYRRDQGSKPADESKMGKVTPETKLLRG